VLEERQVVEEEQAAEAVALYLEAMEGQELEEKSEFIAGRT